MISVKCPNKPLKASRHIQAGFVSHGFMSRVSLTFLALAGYLLLKLALFVFDHDFPSAAAMLSLCGLLGTLVLTFTQVRIMGFSLGFLIALVLAPVVLPLAWMSESKLLMILAIGVQIGGATYGGARGSRLLAENVLPRYANKQAPIYLDQSLQAIQILCVWVAISLVAFLIACVLATLPMDLLALQTNLKPWVVCGAGLLTVTATPLMLPNGMLGLQPCGLALRIAVGAAAFLVAMIGLAIMQISTSGVRADSLVELLFLPIFIATFMQVLAGIWESRKRQITRVGACG